MSDESAFRVREAVLAIARNPEAAGVDMATLSPDELGSALRAAASQGLATASSVSLRRGGLAVPSWLEDFRFAAAVRRNHILEVLGRITPALDNSGIPWVVLKGPVVAASLERPELRDFVDLDILVPGGSIAELISVLESVGIERINQNWAGYVRYGVAEFPVQIDGVQIDVHWHLIPLRRTRIGFDLDISAMLNRRRRISFQGLDFPTLDPIDHLTHLCIHAGVSGANKAGWLRDVYATVTASEIDWTEFTSRLVPTGAGPMLAQMLDRVNHVIGVAVPTDVIDALRPSLLMTWRRRSDLRQRSVIREEGRLFTGFPVAISRSSTLASARAASVTLFEQLMGRIGHPPRWSTFDPRSALYWELPTPSARDGYFELASAAAMKTLTPRAQRRLNSD